jgi:hypothetical protein
MVQLTATDTGPPGNIWKCGPPAIQLNTGNTAYFMIECENIYTCLGVSYGPDIRT